jgi:pilus assembly protein Flp/PilA
VARNNKEGKRFMRKELLAFLRDEEGLTMVEYAVAGALISAAAVTAFSFARGTAADDPSGGVMASEDG